MSQLYQLPDGSTLEVGPARFRAPELLFRPDLLGDESRGIHQVGGTACHLSGSDGCPLVHSIFEKPTSFDRHTDEVPLFPVIIRF